MHNLFIYLCPVFTFIYAINDNYGTICQHCTSTYVCIVFDGFLLQLSSATLTGLHQIVRAVQEYDYNAALAIVAQIVNVGSFTEFGVFMPGVKVLLQTAVQLQVFVQ